LELILIAILCIVLIQTSYLVYRQFRATSAVKNDDILCDTSVLIDGRILAFARSGLISGRLVVPRSVVRELQFMADKADHDKRERARYGLEVIEKLQELTQVDTVVTDDGSTSEHGVDEQLILLAQKHGAKLCTIDYNLNKAARVQAVEIININELAHALRVIHLPGETVSVELVQPGQDKKQGVGYLDDGTMVVVDDSRDYIGKTVSVQLTRVLQTAAGRMMFAKRASVKKSSHDASRHAQATKSTVSQTPGEAKGRRQMIAPSSSSQTRGDGRTSSPTSELRTVAPELSQTPTNPPKKQPQAPSQNTQPAPKKPQPKRSRSQRRGSSSPEDALVNLANK